MTVEAAVNPRARYAGWVAPLCWLAVALEGYDIDHDHDDRIPRGCRAQRAAGDSGDLQPRLAVDVHLRRDTGRDPRSVDAEVSAGIRPLLADPGGTGDPLDRREAIPQPDL